MPFALKIDEAGEGLVAGMVTGEEAAPASSVEVDGKRVVLNFDFYDAEITAEVSDDGALISGSWRRTGEGGVNSTLGFSAVRGDTTRFRPRAETDLSGGDGAALPSVDGIWATTFTDEDGSEPAQGEFRQEGNHVTGTFLTPTGDYRFLEGSYEDGLLRLSTFDGSHAFLFHARAQADGTLEGDFWSRDTYHATWVARPAEADESILPSDWTLARLTNDEGRFRFAFADLEGQTVTESDPRFAGKVVIVNIFGSWCPNCNDEAPLLAEWDRRFRDQGLAIVGLAYEFTGNVERDRRQVRRFSERHGIDYLMLLAGGTTDKADAALTLPDLDRIVAYPTSVFIGRDGRVRKIHSGFSGPGTGAHHEKLVAELESLVGSLLAEDVPGT